MDGRMQTLEKRLSPMLAKELGLYLVGKGKRQKEKKKGKIKVREYLNHSYISARLVRP